MPLGGFIFSSHVTEGVFAFIYVRGHICPSRLLVQFERNIFFPAEMKIIILFTISLIYCVDISVDAVGILYPRASESREQISLDGLWKFVVANKSDQNKGFVEKWYSKDLQQLKEDVMDMPVPSSYNDITQDPLIRGKKFSFTVYINYIDSVRNSFIDSLFIYTTIKDHIGWVFYQKHFFVAKSWKALNVNLRFGSVNYHAIVVCIL